MFITEKVWRIFVPGGRSQVFLCDVHTDKEKDDVLSQFERLGIYPSVSRVERYVTDRASHYGDASKDRPLFVHDYESVREVVINDILDVVKGRR